jgi:hypothetical protein
MMAVALLQLVLVLSSSGSSSSSNTTGRSDYFTTHFTHFTPVPPPPPTGAKVCFGLPGGSVRVTVVAVDLDEPTWIVAHIVSGAAFVDGERHGCVFWNGLDDNLWPVPPGSYGLRGIVMDAAKWAADGQYHSVVPKYTGGITPFNVSVTAPSTKQKMFVDGDPVGQSFTTVATAVNFKGREQFANFYHGCEWRRHHFDFASLGWVTDSLGFVHRPGECLQQLHARHEQAARLPPGGQQVAFCWRGRWLRICDQRKIDLVVGLVFRLLSVPR